MIGFDFKVGGVHLSQFAIEPETSRNLSEKYAEKVRTNSEKAPEFA